VSAVDRTAAAAAAGLALEGVDFDGRTLENLARRAEIGPTMRRGWLVRRSLLAADVAGLTSSYALAAAGVGTAADLGSILIALAAFGGSLPLWVVLAKLHGLYDRDEERTDHSTVDEFFAVFHFVTVGVWSLFVFDWLFDTSLTPATLCVFSLCAIVLVTTARSVARTFCHRQIAFLQNTLIVGAGEVGQLVARKLLAHPEYGINLVGFVDDSPRKRRSELGHLAMLGTPDDISSLVETLDIERVIIAFSKESHDELLELIRSLKDLDVRVDIVPRLFEIFGRKVGIHAVEGLPLVGLPALRLARSSRLLKRTLDLTLASLGLILLSPLFAVLALATKIDSSGPILFRQTRMGAGGRTFRIFKFRTMTADAEARKGELAHLNMHLTADPRMFKIPEDPRITHVGRLLRRYRIDELPQLINVVRGEMSLVGPRPLILAEDRHVESWARCRLDLKPGMTGLWQVLGASDIPFDEMTKLDYLYVTNWSLTEDLRLIFRTFPTLLRTRNAY
jgi:exopolysaccharide biosynthesis polyprenyl glycosylphosphotransferase